MRRQSPLSVLRALSPPLPPEVAIFDQSASSAPLRTRKPSAVRTNASSISTIATSGRNDRRRVFSSLKEQSKEDFQAVIIFAEKPQSFAWDTEKLEGCLELFDVIVSNGIKSSLTHGSASSESDRNIGTFNATGARIKIAQVDCTVVESVVD